LFDFNAKVSIRQSIEGSKKSGISIFPKYSRGINGYGKKYDGETNEPLLLKYMELE
jgi:hypothetical protein